ncbi:MAG TPA: OmpH family outer membrane protein [Polyangiaceae bacterium]|nr:OmpH family outer membrane protein [Polyangiaceae bacterium]
MSYRSRALAWSGAALVALSLVSSSASAQQPEAAAGAATGTKVGVLDTRRVIMETEEGLRVQANLRKLFESRQVDLSSKEKQLQQEYEDLAKEEKNKGKSADLERRKNEWKGRYAQLQQTLVDYQKEMQRKEGELTGPMLQKIGSIVKGIATKSGYDVVIEKQAAAYFRNDLDITDQVIQVYNAGDTGPKAPKDAPKDKPGAPKPAAPKPAAPKK